MSFNSALVSGDYTNLRANTFHATQYICLWPNEIVFKSQLTSAYSADSYAAVAFGSTLSGNSANIRVGMRVVIGPNNDIQDAIARARSNNGAFDGRVRAAVSGSTLPINETSVTLSSSAYLWVIRDYPVMNKLARESGGTYYKDWDKTFTQLPPIVGNLQTAYAGICSGTPEEFSVSLSPTAIAGRDGGSISGWNWVLPNGVTFGSGNASSQNVTLDCEAGAHDVLLEVQDGALTTQRHIYIFAVPSDMSSVVSLGFEGAEIEGDVEDGYTARIAGFENFSNVLDNTLCVIFDVSHYGGSEATVSTDIRMVGRLSTERNSVDMDSIYANVRALNFQVTGAAGQLGRIEAPLITIVDDESPAAWDEIDKATYWRAIAYTLQEHSTYLLTHSLAFDDTSDNYRLSVWGVNAGDFLSEMNDLAGSIGASMEFAPDGRTRVAIRATQLDSTDRNALTTVANWTNQDFIGLAINRDLEQQVGIVEAAGGTYNTTTNEVLPYLSQAPGIAPANSVGKRTMPGQALTINLSKAAAEAELNARTGNYFAEENPTTEMVVSHPDGYGWLIPSRAQWYTWTLTAADTNLRGLAYTTSQRWLLIRVSTRHDNSTGTKTVEGTYRLEVSGSVGKAVDPPAGNDIDDPIPGIPPNIGEPDLGFDWGDIVGDLPTPGGTPPFWQVDQIPKDGNSVIVLNKNGAWSTTTYKMTASRWFDVTPPLPSGYEIVDGALGFVTEYYILANNGATSIVFYTENPFGNAPSWATGNVVTGVYSEIEVTGTRGSIYLRGSQEEDTPCWNYRVDEYGSFFDNDGALATYVPGLGWRGDAGGAFAMNRVQHNFGSFIDISHAEIHVSTNYRVRYQVFVWRVGGVVAELINEIVDPGSYILEWDGLRADCLYTYYRITNSTPKGPGDAAYIHAACFTIVPGS